LTALGSCSPLTIIVKEILALSPGLGASTPSFEEADLTQSREGAKEDKETELDANCSETGRSLRN
jgi:hypothetical protein